MIKEYIDKDTLGEILSELYLNFYPIGSVYLSFNNANPKSLFGGEWEQIKDRFLLAAGDTYSVESTGGEATHKLTVEEMPSHTHAPTTSTPDTATYNQYAFTINRHFSSSSTQRFAVDKGTGYTVMGANRSADDYGGNNDINQSLNTAPTGGSTAHNNLPPYLVVYIWKRVS